MLGREPLRAPRGGRAFHVYMRTIATATVPVVLERSDLEDIARKYGCPVAELPDNVIIDSIMDRAADGTPTVGVCCSGGRWATDASLELNDEWESVDQPLQIPATPLYDAYTEIVAEDGD